MIERRKERATNTPGSNRPLPQRKELLEIIQKRGGSGPAAKPDPDPPDTNLNHKLRGCHDILP